MFRYIKLKRLRRSRKARDIARKKSDRYWKDFYYFESLRAKDLAEKREIQRLTLEKLRREVNNEPLN